MKMKNALFDPIINSEDEMIARAHLEKDNKAFSCMYLRAYIMASLCFEPYLMVTDTAANLNRAFRALIDESEGFEHYRYKSDSGYLYVPEVADFEWLIRSGHIQFAVRNKYNGSFTELFRDSQQKMKHVDRPNEEYTKKLDAICSDQYMRTYDIGEASQRFTSEFWKNINRELSDANLFPDREKLLRELTYRLSNQGKISYSIVKSTLLEELNLKKTSPEYQYVRDILRRSYDYNIPNILGLDYCMSLQNVRPSRKREWKLELGYEKVLQCDLECNVFGLAALPACQLIDIWDSTEYKRFEKQLDLFRMDRIEPEEYMETVRRYLAKINDVVENFYGRKYRVNNEKNS